MEHFICQGECAGESDHAKSCESETCSHKGQAMAACHCEDGAHKSEAPAVDQEKT